MCFAFTCLYIAHMCLVFTVPRREHYHNNTDCYDPPSECWEPNLGLLQEQCPSKDWIRKHFLINRELPFKKRNKPLEMNKRRKKHSQTAWLRKQEGNSLLFLHPFKFTFENNVFSFYVPIQFILPSILLFPHLLPSSTSQRG